MITNKWLVKIIRAVLIGSVNSFVFCPSCASNPNQDIIKVLLYYIITFFVIYELIDIAVKYFNKKYNWIKQPKRLIAANALFILLLFLPINYIAVELNFGNFPELYSKAQIYFLKLNNLFIALLIMLYLNNKHFYNFWEKSVIKRQEISKLQIKYELSALKNQINPHFLFNNFNTLTHLVSEQHPEAESYVLQLANMYRYLLDEKKEDIVAIEKEFKMMQSFIYLLKIKYDNSIDFDYKESSFTNYKIAPFTLQLLIENAVKHNVINEENKLIIQLFTEKDFLVIRNNNLDTPSNIYSSGIGLTNIKNRYKLLSKKDIIIKETSKTFSVKIPKIINENSYS